MTVYPPRTPSIPDRLRASLARHGYCCQDDQLPACGGVILFLRTKKDQIEAAFYLIKPSTIEWVSSDELRRAMEFAEEKCIPLRHAVSTSPFSPGAQKLAKEARIRLWPV